MVYLFGFFGFAFGFAVGLGVINVLLRQRSVDEVRADKSARTVYGLFVWIFAAIGLIIGVWLYRQFF